MKKFVTLSTSGDLEIQEVDSSSEYEFLKNSVGGWIEAVPLRAGDLSGLIMWVNEEGKLTGLPGNIAATAVWVSSYGLTDVMVGSVVITGDDGLGETASLTDQDIEKIKQVVDRYSVLA